VAKLRVIGTILSFTAFYSRLRHVQPSIPIWRGFCRKPNREVIHSTGAKSVQFDPALVLAARMVSSNTSGSTCSESYRRVTRLTTVVFVT
jgi:hypothetical protein